MITAARIGKAPLTADWTQLAHLTEKASAFPTETWTACWQTLQDRFRSEVGFFDAPINDDLSQLSACKKLAEHHQSKNWSDCLFLGIGGSALGPASLLHALTHRVQNPIRFHFVDNIDPIDWQITLRSLQPARTLVIIVTKSGTTFETLAQSLIVQKWLIDSGQDWKRHWVVITDPQKGDLRQFAQAHALDTLPIAPSLGGRFSVFSPVGLFAAALCGLAVENFIRGAQEVRESFEKSPIQKHPVFQIAELLFKNASKRSVHVCMPYSTRLKRLGDWWVQLWAESLAKGGQGFTPVSSVGATDQHSLIQLLNEGPDDKITHLISIGRVPDDGLIPQLPGSPGSLPYPALRQLEGHSLKVLLDIEMQATAQVLSRLSRPYWTLQIDELDERGLGALYFFFACLTVTIGTRMAINPFDQPGVEAAKLLIRESLDEVRQSGFAGRDETPADRLRRGHENG